MLSAIPAVSAQTTCLEAMNFECPGCQAKYQIADEKVASKAVKMKCRKCQTPILISSLGARRALGVSEGKALTMPPGMSVAPVARSLAPPSMPRRRSLAAGPDASPAATPTHAAPDAPTPAPGGVKLTNGSSLPLGDAASLHASAGHHAEAPPPPSLAPPSIGPRKSAAPPLHKPSAPLHKASLPPSRPPARVEAAAVDAEPGDTKTGPSSLRDPAPSRGPSLASPLGAMNIQIRESEEAQPPSLRRMASKIPMELWHVGVDGEVKGPWTRTEIAERCQRGEITGEALVWKEGMSGWAPLGNVEALRELVAKAETKANVAGAAGGTVATPEAPVAPAPEISATLSSVTDVEAQPARAPRRDSIWARVEAHGPKRAHVAFLVVAAAVFGAAMMFVFSGEPETKIVEKVVEVPAKGTVKPADNVPPPPTVADAPAEAASAAGPSTKSNGTAARPSGDSSAAPAPDGKSGLKGLSGLSGLSSAGPQAGPTSGASASATQALDSAQIESTVAKYRNSVKRGCWQPALDSRSKGAPSSARVNVTITVSAGGAVKNVSSSGDPTGYRGLASCIQSRVSTWTFPASSGSTTVNVPFVFATQ